MSCRLLVALGLVLGTQAWVLPGTAPAQYNEGEFVELKVNKITSPKTVSLCACLACASSSPVGAAPPPGARATP